MTKYTFVLYAFTKRNVIDIVRDARLYIRVNQMKFAKFGAMLFSSIFLVYLIIHGVITTAFFVFESGIFALKIIYAEYATLNLTILQIVMSGVIATSSYVIARIILRKIKK
jgi:hypothetical protein